MPSSREAVSAWALTWTSTARCGPTIDSVIFDLRIGYGFTHVKSTVADVSIGQFQRTLVLNQTLHGPSVGFGITF